TENRAEGNRVGFLRIESGVTYSHRGDLERLIARAAHTDRCGIVDRTARALAIEALGEGRLAHVARQGRAESQVAVRLEVETDLVRFDRSDARVARAADGEVRRQFLPALEVEDRHLHFGERLLHVVIALDRRDGGELDEVRAAAGEATRNTANADLRCVERRT